MFTDTFWDFCNSLGSHFGHDRAKNNLGGFFLAQAVNRLCDYVYAVVGLRTLWGAGMGAWVT